jgi:4-amino-4-deoxy-L-arabinose transferase-like glycosyltransferase
MDAPAATLSPPAPAEKAAAATAADTTARPVWQLAWLTPGVCRALFVLLLAFGFLSHLRYLHHDCPIDLSGDEAQYWDWSRNLDLSYYSKGPLVAYVIRASTALFGNHMPAVRYPALVLGVMTSVVTYLLALRLFRSDRVALGTVLLYHLVPMFVAGSVLMTIDPPFYFCWALATYLLTFAVFDGGRRWAWLAVGAVAGVGFLAKYAMFLWFLPAAIVLLVDRPSRRWLRTPWPYAACSSRPCSPRRWSSGTPATAGCRPSTSAPRPARRKGTSRSATCWNSSSARSASSAPACS